MAAVRAFTFLAADAFPRASPPWWPAGWPVRERAIGSLAATVIIDNFRTDTGFGLHLRRTTGRIFRGDVIRFARLFISDLGFVALRHVRLSMAHFCYWRNGSGLAQLLGKKSLSDNCQMANFGDMDTLARVLWQP